MAEPTDIEHRVAVARVGNRWVAGALGAVALYEASHAPKRVNGKVLVALAAAVALSTVRVVAGRDGLTVGFGPWGWPRRRIGPERMENVRVEDLAPLRYGGWGYRIRGRDTRVVVRSGPAVVVDLKSGGSFGVTVPDAESFARVLLNAIAG